MGSLPQLSIIKGPTKPLKPNLLHKIFEDVATGESSDKTALIFEENGVKKTYTYRELNEITNKLARVITHAVVNNHLSANTDGDFIVAVSMQPSDHLVVALLAIWKAGAAYLPIDPSFPGPRIEHIVRESKPFLILYEEDSKFFMDTHKLPFDKFLQAGQKYNSSSLLKSECLQHQKDDLAIVLYTSGSTGVPKGVRLPHKIILNRLQWQFKAFPYSSTEKTGVFKTALTFVDSVSEIWGPLINGLAILVVPKSTTKDPEKLVGTLESYKIERLVLVPSLLRSILMYLELSGKKSSLKNLKTWVCSGETLVTSLAEEFFKYFPENEHKLCNFYGSTEVMGDVTYHVISNPGQLKHQDKVPIGLPVDNTIIYLLDPDFRPVKAGDVGELFVSGLNLAAGYVNGRDPDKFVENPLAIDPTFARLYRTGDFARICKGTILYEGRTDSQVKIRGHRVDLSEVEKAVNSVEGIEKGVVLCYKPGEINQALLAFVTTSALMNENQIENILRKKLAQYMVPQVVILETIPLLVNGKIDRQALLKSYENTNNNDDACYQVDIDYTGVPESKMKPAKVLFETIASVLNRSARSAISLDANFYEIGGNSLNSIFTITTLNQKGYHISISDFIAAIDLGEVLERMCPENKNYHEIISQPPAFTTQLIKLEDKEEVYDMIVSSFYNKAELEHWLMPDIHEQDYVDVLDYVWELLVSTGLSFMMKNSAGKVVGAALNFDCGTEPDDAPFTSRILVIFEYLESLEGPVRKDFLPKGQGKVFHSFMMGTKSHLTAKENVMVMQAMEDEIIRMAREKNFEGVFTTNTSPLTQQLASDVYGYETLVDDQANTYVASDGTKPFGLAPDSQRTKVQWKQLKQ